MPEPWLESRRSWMLAVLSASLGVGARARAVQNPPRVAAVLYRGRPLATARAEDLAAIKATGFSTVAWPHDFRSGQASARDLAATVGLQLITVNVAAPGDGTVRVDGSARARYVAADAWRAVQRGAMTVVFDPGAQAGAGMTDAAGRMRPWVEPARAFSRQLAANPRLFEWPMSVPVVVLDAGGLDLRVSLHQAVRAWVLVATNAGTRAGRFTARLPAAVPSALWTSLLDGSGMSMLGGAEGPRWTADIDAGRALVYVIDRR